MISIYLDTCCLNRPFDEPGQLRVRAEAAAVIEVLQGVATGQYTLVSSSVIEWEISKHPDQLKRMEITKLLTLASSTIELQQSMVERARVLESTGFKSIDALHLAVVEGSQTNCFLTTDDKLIKLATKLHSKLSTTVMNPVQWIWTQIS